MGTWLAGNVPLALGAAALWGVGDFSGGMGVSRAGGSPGAALRFVLVSHSISLLVLASIAALLSAPFPHGLPLVAGLAAGVAGGLALVAFYVALSRGTMGAAAAISGLLAAAVPSLVSALLEGAPGWRLVSGFAVAGAAIWLIGGGSRAPGERAAALLAVAAGFGFGLYFAALRFASPAGLVWPMVTARLGSIFTCASILLALRFGGAAKAVVTREVVWWAALAALFDTCGNLLFVGATRAGRLDVAAVLASLYPASTILLAAVLLRQRPSPRQTLGMGVALAAVVLVAL